MGPGFSEIFTDESAVQSFPGPHGHRPTPATPPPATRLFSTPSPSGSTPSRASSPSAHNGNLVNLGNLRARLERSGRLFPDHVRLRDHRSSSSPTSRAGNAGSTPSPTRFSQVEGAFSIVMMNPRPASSRPAIHAASRASLPWAGFPIPTDPIPSSFASEKLRPSTCCAPPTFRTRWCSPGELVNGH